MIRMMTITGARTFIIHKVENLLDGSCDFTISYLTKLLTENPDEGSYVPYSSIFQCAYETKGYLTLLGEKSAPPSTTACLFILLTDRQRAWRRSTSPTLVTDLGNMLLTPA